MSVNIPQPFAIDGATDTQLSGSVGSTLSGSVETKLSGLPDTTPSASISCQRLNSRLIRLRSNYCCV